VQPREGLELVGGMQRFAHDVFRQRQFLRRPGGMDQAGNRRRPGRRLALGQQFERAHPPAAADDFEFAGFAAVAIQDGANGKALQQAMGGDAGCQFFQAGLAAGAAHVGGGGHQFVERDMRRSIPYRTPSGRA